MNKNNRKFMFFVGHFGEHGFYVNESTQTFCFGCNENGQLNVGDKRNRLVPEVVEFFEGEEILDICVGSKFSVFRTSKRVVSCGSGDYGKTSLGDKKDRYIAEKVLLEDEEAIVSDISVGYSSTFFLCSGRVYLAGSTGCGNRCYQLAVNLVVGTRICVLKTEIEEIVTGGFYALFFGKNEIFVGGAERVGLGESNKVLVKLDFFKERGLSMSSVVPGEYTVYFLCGNDVYISGSNFSGQYGNHSYDKNETNQPVLSTSIRNIDSCVGGSTHFVWRNVDGRIFGTGSNQSNKLGLNVTEMKVNVPTLIPMPSEARNSIGQIAAADSSTYFISNDGQTIYGTGWNSFGQLFNGNTNSLSKVTLLRTDLNLKQSKSDLGDQYDSRNMELQRERLEFVLALEPDLKVKFNDSELEIFSCLINPESRLSRRIKDGAVEVNRNLRTTVFDTDLLHSLVFGADVQTQLDENIQNYLDFFLLFNAMGMRKHEYCLLRMVSRITSLKKLVKLFVMSCRLLESPLSNRGVGTRDADIDQMFERQTEEEISFESNFTLNIFNTLAESGVEEIRKEMSLMKILERLTIWGDLLDFKIRPLEKLIQYEDLQETTFNELFLEHTKVLFRNRKKSGNYVVVSADEKEIATHKEILCVKSDYFFKVIKFGGRETRKEGFLLLERLNYRELFLVVEFCYTHEVIVQESGDGLVVLMNVLEEIIPYDEAALQVAVEKKIFKLSSTMIEQETFLEEGLLKIGHFFSSTNRTLPEEVKKKFILKLETKVEKRKLKETIEKSALLRVKLKKDEEKKELEERMDSLEETMQGRFGNMEHMEERIVTIEAEMKEMKSSMKEILGILKGEARKRKNDSSSEKEPGKRGSKKRKRK